MKFLFAYVGLNLFLHQKKEHKEENAQILVGSDFACKNRKLKKNEGVNVSITFLLGKTSLKDLFKKQDLFWI